MAHAENSQKQRDRNSRRDVLFWSVADGRWQMVNIAMKREMKRRKLYFRVGVEPSMYAQTYVCIYIYVYVCG